jgi:hypothetical protein
MLCGVGDAQHLAAQLDPEAVRFALLVAFGGLPTLDELLGGNSLFGWGHGVCLDPRGGLSCLMILAKRFAAMLSCGLFVALNPFRVRGPGSA